MFHYGLVFKTYKNYEFAFFIFT